MATHAIVIDQPLTPQDPSITGTEWYSYRTTVYSTVQYSTVLYMHIYSSTVLLTVQGFCPSGHVSRKIWHLLGTTLSMISLNENVATPNRFSIRWLVHWSIGPLDLDIGHSSPVDECFTFSRRDCATRTEGREATWRKYTFCVILVYGDGLLCTVGGHHLRVVQRLIHRSTAARGQNTVCVTTLQCTTLPRPGWWTTKAANVKGNVYRRLVCTVVHTHATNGGVVRGTNSVLLLSRVRVRTCLRRMLRLATFCLCICFCNFGFACDI